MNNSIIMDQSIILFDGVCNFCNRSVNFIIDHDPNGYFKFAALQSEAGKKLAAEYRLDVSNLDTLVLIEEGSVFTHSTAILRIFKKLNGWYPMLYDFIVIPSFLRDPFYQLFARYRYNMFGKRNECRIPTSEERSRFL
jgi:predicted DCC family thiol-disulfide oxidoreductase YuxK